LFGILTAFVDAQIGKSRLSSTPIQNLAALLVTIQSSQLEKALQHQTHVTASAKLLVLLTVFVIAVQAKP
jgi:hypothetical protein